MLDALLEVLLVLAEPLLEALFELIAGAILDGVFVFFPDCSTPWNPLLPLLGRSSTHWWECSLADAVF
jgi:hypothetical protein